jgi:phytoene dehydrogenase-like protein
MKKIVIIGSGIGGLVTGNLLAQKGYKVTIFESHRRPGGYTAGFWRKGFYFESGTLSFESSDLVFRAMKDIGVFENIEFIRQKIRWVSADFDGTPESYNDFKDMFYSAYPSEEDRLGKYFSEVDRMYNAIVSSASGGSEAMRIYQEYGDVTITDFTERFFEKDSKLFRLLKGIGYPEMSALNIGGVVATFLSDYWTVKTGMQSWADVLADNFEKLGGKLKLKSHVDKILTKNGVAVGVSSKKTDYEADCVISASDYKKTFLKLLDNQSLIPEDMQERIKQASVSEGFLQSISDSGCQMRN